MMKKKVKKIPKYAEGTPFYKDANFYSNAGDFLTQQVTNVQQSKLGVTAGGIAKGALSGAAAGAAIGSIVPGIGTAIGAVGGALVGGITSSIGKGHGYNEDSSSTRFADIYEPGSGIASLFGHSKEWAKKNANLVQSGNIAKQQTELIKTDYYNNPNVPIEVKVAEGGIMRQPVDALVSPGEIAINPYTLEYRQFGSDNEEPNSKDNIRTVLLTDDNVKSHAKHMIMPNGKTPADNSKMVLDSNMPEEMKRKMIKKIDNWESAHRTKPQEYAKFSEGTGEDGVEEKPIKKRRNSIWNRLQDKWNASAINDWLENYYNNIDKYEDHAIIDGRLFIKHNGKWYDSHKGGLGNALKGNTLPESGKGYMTDRYQMVPFKQGVYVDVDKSKIVRHKTNNTAVGNITKPNSNNDGPSNPELDFVSFRHTAPNYTVLELDIVSDKDNVAPNLPKKGTVSKPSSGKKTATSRATTSAAPQEEKLTPEQIAESLRILDIGERHWLRGDLKGNAMSEPTGSLASLAKITPEKIKLQGVSNIAPLTGIKPLTDTTGTDSTGYTGSNWRDNLYRMAVLSQPLWDRAEAESVNYESPVYKYMPTAIDVSSQLRDTDQSYALARYNFANLYPNTGAGMAAGLQAASNRAKQLSDIRQYQTNAQNELIGKNVGIYNNWANEHARIMNEVYNKTAANIAAARNINRQNRAAALSNYGQMLRDDKQNAVDRMKFAALKPAILSTYEDTSANDIYKWYKELFG